MIESFEDQLSRTRCIALIGLHTSLIEPLPCT